MIVIAFVEMHLPSLLPIIIELLPLQLKYVLKVEQQDKKESPLNILFFIE